MQINKIVLIGVGLIGGSFALGLKKAGVTARIIGVDRDMQALKMAKTLGIIDDIAESIEQAVRGADFVLLAIPVAQTNAILSKIVPFLEAHTIVSDTGSTKADVVANARLIMQNQSSQFVPAHPIAGRELNGPEAALSDLFVGKKIVITRLFENKETDIQLVAELWQQCHAQIYYLTPQEHDQIFAAVSHLPHLLAYALVNDIANKSHADLLFQYAASGFRDFTRIAGSSPEMWRDISLANKDAMVSELDSYMSQLFRIREHLVQADGAALEGIYRCAQQARHNWINAIESAEMQNKDGGD